MKPLKTAIIGGTLSLLFFVPTAYGHFGALIPSDNIVSKQDSNKIEISAKFIHPMEMHYMEMAKPAAFGVLNNGKKTDLLTSLKAQKGKSPDQDKSYTYWQSSYELRRPGDYLFYLEPTPYWEPAEDLFIIHYTKVCVNMLGLEKGWDEPVGLETEIIPLSRPYGLWTGNLFTGQVLVNGNPVPNAEVEVEYLNESQGNSQVVKAPAEPYITQVVKADDNGVFSYAMPRAGWWGFSALNEASWTISRDNNEKNVEIGAVFWVKTIDMK